MDWRGKMLCRCWPDSRGSKGEGGSADTAMEIVRLQCYPRKEVLLRGQGPIVDDKDRR